AVSPDPREARVRPGSGRFTPGHEQARSGLRSAPTPSGASHPEGRLRRVRAGQREYWPMATLDRIPTENPPPPSTAWMNPARAIAIVAVVAMHSLRTVVEQNFSGMDPDCWL